MAGWARHRARRAVEIKWRRCLLVEHLGKLQRQRTCEIAISSPSGDHTTPLNNCLGDAFQEAIYHFLLQRAWCSADTRSDAARGKFSLQEQAVAQEVSSRQRKGGKLDISALLTWKWL